MFGNPINSGLTLGKVISGISKTLSVANQVIPLYREAKPMINNAKTILSVLRDVGVKTNNSNNTTSNKNANNIKKDTTKDVQISSGNPTFFI